MCYYWVLSSSTAVVDGWLLLIYLFTLQTKDRAHALLFVYGAFVVVIVVVVVVIFIGFHTTSTALAPYSTVVQCSILFPIATSCTRTYYIRYYHPSYHHTCHQIHQSLLSIHRASKVISCVSCRDVPSMALSLAMNSSSSGL